VKRVGLSLSSFLVFGAPAAAQDLRPTEAAVERPKSHYSPYPEQDFANRV
jgi:hypothetical protein